MGEFKITVEVHCHCPTWVLENLNEEFRKSIYRLYVNDDLLTERLWIWDNSKLIQETIWVALTVDDTHSLSLTPVLKNPAQAKFKFNNFSIANTLFESTYITDTSITFKLR